jgi:AcrR family transcriptional regulator
MASSQNEPSFNSGSLEQRSRPGGRTADVTQRVRQAVLELLISGGEEQCTFQNVARRAGVERSTLYRRYPNRWMMMSDAFAAANVDDLSFEPTGSFRGDLICHLSRVASVLGSPLGMAMLAASVVSRLDPASREAAGSFWEFRKRQQEPFVRAAIERGELDPGVSLEELFAAADGPLYFRLLIIGRPIDRQWLETTAEQVCRAFCRQRSIPKMETPS